MALSMQISVSATKKSIMSPEALTTEAFQRETAPPLILS